MLGTENIPVRLNECHKLVVCSHSNHITMMKPSASSMGGHRGLAECVQVGAACATLFHIRRQASQMAGSK